jgi:hypothetical protein
VGIDIPEYINDMIIPILLILLVTFVSYPLVLGYRKAMYVDFILEVKMFSSVYYTFGMHFIQHDTEDPEYVEQEFTLALFLFSISLIFYKHIDDV